MKKLIFLFIVTLILLSCDWFIGERIGLHSLFSTMVLFFSILTWALWRMEQIAPADWQVHVSLAKIVVRLLLSLVFIAVLLYNNEEKISLTIQFIGLYLGYMIFEIVFALTNLRRN